MAFIALLFVVLISTAAILAFNFFMKKKQLKKKKTRLAPGPSQIPIIGSMHHLLGRGIAHRAFRYLSSIHGPVMRLKHGETHILVISSAEAAEEILKNQDINFASRPVSPSVEAVFYGGNDIAFSPYGEYWRQIRRVCAVELFSVKRVRSVRSIREQEVSRLLSSIAAAASVGAAFNLSRGVASLTNSIIAVTSIGAQCENQEMFLSATDEALALLQSLSLADLFPSLPNFINRIAGFRRKHERCRKKLDAIMENIMRGHIEKRARAQNTSNVEEDIMDILLRIQRDGGLQSPLSNDHIKAAILVCTKSGILIAGSETTATTLEWTMSELILSPRVMEKAQREVREAFGSSMAKLIADEELMANRLGYLQLVIKETLRLHPPVPLLLPRENREECEVTGYHVPARTTLMVNVWAIGRDPKYWAEPELFWPERFLENYINMNGTHYELLPFGAGRRICPAVNFGLATVELALAHLLYYFDWKSQIMNGPKFDMSEAAGITTRRKTPLCLLATPYVPLPRA